MNSRGDDSSLDYIVTQGGRFYCLPGKAWRPLTAAEFAASAWQVCQQMPLDLHNPCVQVCEVEADPALPGQWVSLRELLLQLDDVRFRQVGTAAQLLEWFRNHQYCGRCGQPAVPLPNERAMHCEGCRLTNYPRLSPCIIVLVTRGDEVLLARSSRYTLPIFSCLAGFVEAGETLEEAVHREVFEESGLRLTNVRYLQSQPWPFPHQLMVGFHADYLGGELNIDPSEIAEAHWYSVTALPQTPPRNTISGQLIHAYVEERRKPS
jgi:NAD+ diphosphatase